MDVGRHETYFHSPEQIREALEFARDLVDELELADDLRGLAFDKAVQLRTHKHLEIDRVIPNLPNMTIPRGV